MKNSKLNFSSSFIYIFAFVVILVFQQCSSDTKDDIEPDVDPMECDDTNVSFSATVMPIISTNCLSCHNGANANGGIRLENLTDIIAQAAISPGTYGSLYGVISHASGNSPMPKNGSKLSDCDISKIKSWIDAGMLDN